MKLAIVNFFLNCWPSLFAIGKFLRPHLFQMNVTQTSKGFNLIWVFLPLLLGGYYYFSKRIEFLSLIKGDWAKIEFKWVIIFLPILNILTSLPTRFLANQDIAFVRYFLSINLAILAVIPFVFFLDPISQIKKYFPNLIFFIRSR